MGSPRCVTSYLRLAVGTDCHVGDTQGLLHSTRALMSESRSLVAGSLARVLAERSSISDHRSVAESTALLAVLESSCDLDVLVFFHRHPRTLLTPFDLARHVGYRTAEIDASIETLVVAGLVTASRPRESTAARLYEFTPGRWATVLPCLLWLASTADGRGALRQALRHNGDRRVRSGPTGE